MSEKSITIDLQNFVSTITWKIENFTYLYQNTLCCPDFKLHSFKNVFNITLIPTHDLENGKMQLTLTQKHYYASTLCANVRIYVLAADGSRIGQKFFEDEINQKIRSTCSEIKLRLLMENKSLYCPHDTLTIQCQILRSDSYDYELSIPCEIQSKVRDLFNCLLSEENFSINNNSAIEKAFKWQCEPRAEFNFHTRIMVTTMFVLFYDYPRANYFYPVFNHYSPHSPVPVLIFKIETSEIGDVMMRIRRYKPNQNISSYATCKVHLESSGTSGIKGHLFTKDGLNELWAINFNNMFKDHITNLNDKISLKIVFRMSEGNDSTGFEHLKFEEIKKESHEKIDLNSKILSLYNTQKMTDVTLKSSDDKERRAHKLILSACSDVFSAMFEHNFEENIKGEVPISDVDAETLDLMLKYMYSSDLEELDSDKAMKLYTAADKYQIMALKDWCTERLKNVLTIQTTCDIYCFADLHGDSALKVAAIDFAFNNRINFLVSDDLKLFCASRLDVASDIMCLISEKHSKT